MTEKVNVTGLEQVMKMQVRLCEASARNLSIWTPPLDAAIVTNQLLAAVELVERARSSPGRGRSSSPSI